MPKATQQYSASRRPALGGIASAVPLSDIPTVRPTVAGFYLAYFANGDLPPRPMADRLICGMTTAAAGLAVVFGTWGALV